MLSAASLPKSDNWAKAAAMLSAPEDDGAAEGGGDTAVETVSTNIYLMTEWQFNHGEVGHPHALINDEDKCQGHSTSHIIDYDVVPESGMEVYSSTAGSGGRGNVDFTMSLSEFKSARAKCTFRCWERGYESFESAPKQHRASVTGTVSTVAKFKISINTGTGDWLLTTSDTVIPGGYTPSGLVIDSNGNVTRAKESGWHDGEN